MKQDVGFFDVGTECPDIVIEDGDLKADNGLETAMLISLFSDRRVTKEELPPSETDQRGWWADEISEPLDDKIGSILWTTERSKITEGVSNQIRDAVRDSLAWLLEEGIAETVDVTSAIQNEQIVATAKITRPAGDDIPFKFVWDGQTLKLTG